MVFAAILRRVGVPATFKIHIIKLALEVIERLFGFYKFLLQFHTSSIILCPSQLYFLVTFANDLVELVLELGVLLISKAALTFKPIPLSFLFLQPIL